MLREIAIVIIGVLIVDVVKFIFAVRVRYSILKRESRNDRRFGHGDSKFKNRLEEAMKATYAEKMKHKKKH